MNDLLKGGHTLNVSEPLRNGTETERNTSERNSSWRGDEEKKNDFYNELVNCYDMVNIIEREWNLKYSAEKITVFGD
jgi:hypothetical protein